MKRYIDGACGPIESEYGYWVYAKDHDAEVKRLHEELAARRQDCKRLRETAVTTDALGVEVQERWNEYDFLLWFYYRIKDLKPMMAKVLEDRYPNGKEKR